MVFGDPRGLTESPRSIAISSLSSSNASGSVSVLRMTQSGGQGEDPSSDLKAPHPSADGERNGDGTAHGGGDIKNSPDANHVTKNNKKMEGGLSPIPQMQATSYLQGYPAHLTPQPGQGYYPLGYQSQVTPEPPSPAGPGANVYDVGSFFQQPAAFAPHNSPFVPQTPLSPRRTAAMGGIPPASPLFPRVSTATGAAGLMPGSGIEQRIMDGHRAGAPPSPSVPYLSPPLGPNSMYQSYPTNGIGSQADSPEELSAWGERTQQSMFQPGSPQINAQGLPVPYVPGMTRAGNAGRSYSFEDSMLPPSSDQQDQQGNPGYSPYGNSQLSSGAAGGTLFANQPWGYPGGPGDMYGSPASPLQPRPTAQMPVYPGHQMGGGMRQMGLYGQYYPATSPGPPIQTTESNKGPDGANLFIFHIPNHFTNLDMYQLFCPYGTLLSVRIMVEKDTGRSRGFGFVSYDSPASAALAIKELNGFAIGNKRLKVQHKQIRPSDQQHRDNSQGFYGVGGGGDGGFQRSTYASHLPPSGPMAAQSMGPSSPWLTPPQQQGQPVADDVAASGQPVLNPSGGPPNPPVHDGVSDHTTGVVGTDGGLSPLASLEPLRNALPDVAGSE